MNAPEADAMDDAHPETCHGADAAGADGPEAAEVLPGVDRERRAGESRRDYLMRIMREFATGQEAQKRAGQRFPCSWCGGRLEDRCALFVASQKIRRTSPLTGEVGYLGPRWLLCRPCAAIVRRGAWPELVDRASWVDEYRAEAASIALELERALSVEGQVVVTPRYPGGDVMSGDDRTIYPFQADSEAVTSEDAPSATRMRRGHLLPTADPFEAAARAFEHHCDKCWRPATAVLDGRPVCVSCKTRLVELAKEAPDGDD